MIIRDFNCKIGSQISEIEEYVGEHGLGIRNHRGSMMVNFLEEQHLYNANTFFEKRSNRKWTWRSPDGNTRNQIDYILTNNIHMIHDVDVLNRFNTGSDHRLVRTRIYINTKLREERK